MSNKKITLEYNGVHKDLKIPGDYKYQELHYDERDSEKFVYLNLPENKKKVISKALVSDLIHYQNIYTEANEYIDEVLFTSEEINMEYLNNKTGFLKENISEQDVIMIFELEKYFYKFLKIIP